MRDSSTRPEYEDKKMASNDRILVLKVIDGEKPTSSLGVTDPRLFTGENNLHAVMNERNCLWSFKYDSGGLPQPLKQSFTTFDKAYEHASNYFRTRNIKIEEIIE